MKLILDLKKEYEIAQIELAIKELNKYHEKLGLELITGYEVLKKLKPTKPKEDKGVETSDHEPCMDCGGTFFIRTGTCFACITCGASQGCS
jgi:hypothetical protein